MCIRDSLCGFQHTWTSDPSMSCLAAIYFQDAGAIQLRCRVTTESANFILERLNKTSFVSVAKETTTAQIRCGNRRSVHQLHGTQVGTLQHSCSITAGHSAMASSRQQPTDLTFQIRAIPGSLNDNLQDWGPNKLLTRIRSEWRLTVIAATVRIALVDILDLSEVDIPAGVFLHPAVGWG